MGKCTNITTYARQNKIDAEVRAVWALVQKNALLEMPAKVDELSSVYESVAPTVESMLPDIKKSQRTIHP